jgi:hypothetical protein
MVKATMWAFFRPHTDGHQRIRERVTVAAAVRKAASLVTAVCADAESSGNPEFIAAADRLVQVLEKLRESAAFVPPTAPGLRFCTRGRACESGYLAWPSEMDAADEARAAAAATVWAVNPWRDTQADILAGHEKFLRRYVAKWGKRKLGHVAVVEYLEEGDQQAATSESIDERAERLADHARFRDMLAPVLVNGKLRPHAISIVAYPRVLWTLEQCKRLVSELESILRDAALVCGLASAKDARYAQMLDEVLERFERRRAKGQAGEGGVGGGGDGDDSDDESTASEGEEGGGESIRLHKDDEEKGPARDDEDAAATHERWFMQKIAGRSFRRITMRQVAFHLGLAASAPRSDDPMRVTVRLAMRDGESALWHRLGEERRLHCQQVDTVIHVQDLPSSRKLGTDPLGNQNIVPRAYVGQDRQPPGRRRGEQRHVADPAHAHVHCARDWRRREGEHVNRRRTRLPHLLLGHAKPLLLVHDEKPQVLEGERR